MSTPHRETRTLCPTEDRGLVISTDLNLGQHEAHRPTLLTHSETRSYVAAGVTFLAYTLP